MPRWPDRCFDVIQYAENLYDEWTGSCLPVLEAKASGTLENCLAGVQSPQQLSSSWARCSAEATDVPAWLTEVAQCSVTSFITASSMSEQDRDDWSTFIQGIAEVNTLMGFANLFDDHAFLDLAEMENATSFADLTRKAEALMLKEQKRYDRLKTVPDFLEGIVQAALTVPSLRREQIDLLSDTAAQLTEDCEPDAGAEVYTFALDEMARHVEHMQDNLAIAEHGFFCAASQQGFDGWSIGRQQEFLGQRSLGGANQTGDRIRRREWETARSELASAYRSWTNLRQDARLSEGNFAASRERRAAKSRELVTLVNRATDCMESCGDRCALPLETLQQAVAAERNAACTRGGLGDEFELPELMLELGRTATAESSVRSSVFTTRAAMTSRLRRCDVSAARDELLQLETSLSNFVRGEAYARCAAPELTEIRLRLEQCEERCAEPSATRCEFVAVRVKNVKRGTKP